jgi:D-lactate dehydrogenase
LAWVILAFDPFHNPIVDELGGKYVLFTGHQAFLTEKALVNISEVTLSNILDIANNGECVNAVKV